MATWILCAVSYARVALCVVVDPPCSGSSSRYFKKTSYIYHPFVAKGKIHRRWESEKEWQKEYCGHGRGERELTEGSPLAHHIRFPSHTQLWINHSIAWHNRNNSVTVSKFSFVSSCRASKGTKRAELEKYRSWETMFSSNTGLFPNYIQPHKGSWWTTWEFLSMKKMLRDGRKKSLCGWSCLS